MLKMLLFLIYEGYKKIFTHFLPIFDHFTPFHLKFLLYISRTPYIVVTLFGSAPGSDDVIILDRAHYVTLFVVISDPRYRL